MNNIPKIIHQIWMQGESNIPDEFKKNGEKIKLMHPDWQYILWDEIKILKLIQSDYNLCKKYYKYNYLHQKVDFAKLIILYNYGGICIDMDAYTVKPLDELIEKYGDYEFVISNLKSLGYLGNFIACGKYDYCVNNGNYFGKKKARIVNFLIENLNTKCNMFQNKMWCINKTTGPDIFNRLLRQFIKYNPTYKVKILNYDILEPCLMDYCYVTDNTYIVHKHAGTWVNAFMKKIGNLYIGYPNLFIFVLFIMIIFIFFIIFKK